MNFDFPAAVPEIPVRDINKATAYYERILGFTLDWGNAEGGIVGISRGHCRLFLTNAPFREVYGNTGPVLSWFNLNSKEEVNQVYEEWIARGATIVTEPEEKPWKLYEFMAADLDGNLMRVFYDFAREVA